ncbi:hypothetical protein C8J56DRAFT_1163746 [Mycena floridula]|nr:hypothetical protein C8J56DRAFT_1163746 [Mycena floridula]
MNPPPPALNSLARIRQYFDAEQQLSNEQKTVSAHLNSLEKRILFLQRTTIFNIEDWPQLDIELWNLCLKLHSAQLTLPGTFLVILEWPFSPEESQEIVSMCNRFRSMFFLGKDTQASVAKRSPIVEQPSSAGNTDADGAVVRILANNVFGDIQGPVIVYTKIYLNHYYFRDDSQPRAEPFQQAETTERIFCNNKFGDVIPHLHIVTDDIRSFFESETAVSPETSSESIDHNQRIAHPNYQISRLDHGHINMPTQILANMMLGNVDETFVLQSKLGTIYQRSPIDILVNSDIGRLHKGLLAQNRLADIHSHSPIGILAYSRFGHVDGLFTLQNELGTIHQKSPITILAGGDVGDLHKGLIVRNKLGDIHSDSPIDILATNKFGHVNGLFTLQNELGVVHQKSPINILTNSDIGNLHNGLIALNKASTFRSTLADIHSNSSVNILACNKFGHIDGLFTLQNEFGTIHQKSPINILTSSDMGDLHKGLVAQNMVANIHPNSPIQILANSRFGHASGPFTLKTKLGMVHRKSGVNILASSDIGDLHKGLLAQNKLADIHADSPINILANSKFGDMYQACIVQNELGAIHRRSPINILAKSDIGHLQGLASQNKFGDINPDSRINILTNSRFGDIHQPLTLQNELGTVYQQSQVNILTNTEIGHLQGLLSQTKLGAVHSNSQIHLLSNSFMADVHGCLEYHTEIGAAYPNSRINILANSDFGHTQSIICHSEVHIDYNYLNGIQVTPNATINIFTNNSIGNINGPVTICLEKHHNYYAYGDPAVRRSVEQTDVQHPQPYQDEDITGHNIAPQSVVTTIPGISVAMTGSTLGPINGKAFSDNHITSNYFTLFNNFNPTLTINADGPSVIVAALLMSISLSFPQSSSTSAGTCAVEASPLSEQSTASSESPPHALYVKMATQTSMIALAMLSIWFFRNDQGVQGRNQHSSDAQVGIAGSSTALEQVATSTLVHLAQDASIR